MTGKSDDTVRSISCTECAAPLHLHGGHKVRTLTCSYCGSVLDMRDEYKVLHSFLNRRRPPAPFELGASAELRGVQFTIIGLIEFQTADCSGWLEYSLYSPTHGYAWLEIENGHFVLSHRVRDAPLTAVPTARKQTFKARGRTFEVFERYSAKITYVEGELTWIARAGDAVLITDAVDPPFVYSIERTAEEEEYSFGEYIEAQTVYAAFGIKDAPPKPSGVHPAAPFRESGITAAMSRAAMFFVPLALGLSLYALLWGNGAPLLSTDISTEQFTAGSQTETFDVSDANSLLQLELHSQLNNAWAWFEVEILKDSEVVYSLGKQISYYSGYDGGEHWSEGNQSAKAYFKLPQAGTYALSVTGVGGTGERGTTPQNASLRVSVREGVVVGRYFLALLVITSLAFAWRHLARLIFETRRWQDDDD